MNKVDKALLLAAADKVEQAKANLTAIFTSYIRDTSNSLSERLMAWECFAGKALPIADYCMGMSDTLNDIFVGENVPRYQLVTLQDLAERIIPDDLWEQYYGDSEEDGISPEACVELICSEHEAIADLFEQIFALEFCGFVNDW